MPALTLTLQNARALRETPPHQTTPPHPPALGAGGPALAPPELGAGESATGPKTSEGKRIAARNATTHGLFARDIVLPHLGEDPEAFDAFLQELTAQIKPRNLLERHYTEKIAAASWRLRRLHRWQAQLFENADITEDQALHKLDSVMRHETALHRQIDQSVKMIGRELTHMFEDRARKQAMYEYGVSERYRTDNPSTDLHLTGTEYEMQERPLAPPDLDLSRLDTAPAEPRGEPQPAPEPPDSQICQNELPPLPLLASALERLDAAEEERHLSLPPFPGPPWRTRRGEETGGLPPGLGSSVVGSSGTIGERLCPPFA